VLSSATHCDRPEDVVSPAEAPEAASATGSFSETVGEAYGSRFALNVPCTIEAAQFDNTVMDLLKKTSGTLLTTKNQQFKEIQISQRNYGS
jgi:hypothetical protein